MPLPTTPDLASAIRLLRADKELGAHLLTIKCGAVSHGMQQAQAYDQRVQREVRLAHADLIVRSGSDSWSLTALGQEVSTYMVQYEADEELALMYRRLEFTVDSIFLDLGCGAGPALVKACELSIAPHLLIGIDIDRSALLAASEFLGSRRSRCLLVQADLAALPIRAEAISHVCSRLSLPYVSQRASMAELGRVLAPGGQAFLQLHAFKFYVQLLCEEFGNWKRVVMNSFCLLNGFLFWLFGVQLQVHRSMGLYQELYQTLSGITFLLKQHCIDVLWYERARLFRVFGRKRLA